MYYFVRAGYNMSDNTSARRRSRYLSAFSKTEIYPENHITIGGADLMHAGRQKIIFCDYSETVLFDALSAWCIGIGDFFLPRVIYAVNL